MAQILLKNTSDPGRVPTHLAQGEIAINTADGTMFYSDGAANNIKQFGISSSYALTASFASTSSFITGSDVYGPFGSNSIISSSFAVSSSRAVSSSYALTASYAMNGGGGGTPGGSTTQIQYNNAGTFAGSSNLTWNGTVLGVTGSALITGSLQVIGQLRNGNPNLVTPGDYAHAEGYSTIATGSHSHAEGIQTTSSGSYSHAEGDSATAYGNYSHAEGSETKTYGDSSHAEGYDTRAFGNYSHAEGESATTYGNYSHAEGDNSRAFGGHSHAEGSSTITTAATSHAEGLATIAGYRSPLIAAATDAGGNIAANGDQTPYFTASTDVIIIDQNGYFIGTFILNTISYNAISYITTFNIPDYPSQYVGYLVSTTYGQYSHAEGKQTVASGYASHAEGIETEALGNYSHAEGYNTQAIGEYSHAEGISTVTRGTGSHAEGFNAYAYGIWSHAEGQSTIASGSFSHAEGTVAYAYGDSSHAEGYYTTANGDYQHVQGQYNITSSAQSAFIHGNGTADNARSNLIFASGSQVQITGSLKVSGSITGSLFGTASFAVSSSRAVSSSYSISSSYALTASYAMNGGGGGSGITSLNGLTGAAQTLVTGSSGTNFNISSSGTVHTFNLPDASSTARGVITTGVQDINGRKSFLTDIAVNGVNIGAGPGGVSSNVRIGRGAGDGLTSGGYNTFIGTFAADTANTTGSTVIGSNTTPLNTGFYQDYTLNIGKRSSLFGPTNQPPQYWSPDRISVATSTNDIILRITNELYSAVFIDYVISYTDTSLRAGTIKAVWDKNGVVKWTEDSTDSIGDMSTAVFDVDYDAMGGFVFLRLTNNNNSNDIYCNFTSRLLLKPILY